MQFNRIYTPDIFDLHILSKIASGDFFSLDMLLKRREGVKGRHVQFAKVAVAVDKGCRFQ